MDLSPLKPGEDSLLPAGLLIAGGAGLFAGSYFVKDARIAGVMKVGGLLAAIAGVVVGGEALLDKLGLGSLLKQKGPETVSVDPATEHEIEIASGNVSGEFIMPTDGGNVELPTFGQLYKVQVRLINGTNKARRVSVALQGTESHFFSEEEVGGSLGEVTIPANSSLLRQIEVNSTSIINAIAPTISMGLFIDGMEVSRVSYTTS